jgi:diguanylate cyclase (GGDEF)-like protein
VAIVVACLGAATIAEFIFHINLHIDTLFAADALSPIPGRPSMQTAMTFVLMGIVLANIRARKGVFAFLIDGLTLVLSLLILTFFSGFLFGALRLYGLSLQTRVSPPTLLCMVLLAVTVFNRRAEYGLFSILIGGGIGGRTARLAAPWALFLPFTLSGVRGLLMKHTPIPEEYALALSASVMAIFGFCLILVLSRRVNRLEHAIRELSLRDELTGLYNRRGFYVLAEQAHRLAQRAGAPFFVLFVDLDYLKLINDTLGHEVGSERLKQVARILEQTFRETDVVGRLGGDEFVAAGRADAFDLDAAAQRLEQGAAALNDAGPTQRYPISFSLGFIISPGASTESLDSLIERADAVMYEAKRTKKRARTQSGITTAWPPPVAKSH